MSAELVTKTANLKFVQISKHPILYYYIRQLISFFYFPPTSMFYSRKILSFFILPYVLLIFLVQYYRFLDNILILIVISRKKKIKSIKKILLIRHVCEVGTRVFLKFD